MNFGDVDFSCHCHYQRQRRIAIMFIYLLQKNCVPFFFFSLQKRGQQTISLRSQIENILNFASQCLSQLPDSAVLEGKQPQPTREEILVGVLSYTLFTETSSGPGLAQGLQLVSPVLKDLVVGNKPTRILTPCQHHRNLQCYPQVLLRLACL